MEYIKNELEKPYTQEEIDAIIDQLEKEPTE